MIKVFYFAPENSAVGWYRFYQPLKNLEKRGLIESKSWGFDFSGKRFDLPNIKKIKEIGDWADMVIFGRMDMPDYFRIIQIFKEIFGKKVLLDIDDNIFSISPYLQARQGYDPNGQPIKIHKKTAKYVDGIIVSVEYLKKIYEKYNKTWIVPNAVEGNLKRRNHNGVNIGYLCSASHLENAKIVESTLMNIVRKYANVKLFYSRQFQGFMDLVPEELKHQINYLPWFPLKGYLKYVNQLDLDIGLAPLMDNPFNRCKSNIRILEYWQNQIAVIASPVGEYVKTIKHGYNGYLAQDDEWEEQLDDLIQHPEKRKYLIKNADESLKEYNISDSADKYYEVLRENLNAES